jgi:hypothetical protein
MFRVFLYEKKHGGNEKAFRYQEPGKRELKVKRNEIWLPVAREKSHEGN